MTRRNVWLGLVSVVIGPLVGSLTFIAITLITDVVFFGTQPSSNLLLREWPVVLTAGYVFGFAPGLGFAAAMALVSRKLPTLAQRLVAAPVVGALLSIAILSVILFGQSLGGLDLDMLLILAITGAVAGLVSLAIVELFHPLPTPAPEP
ncbi:hypothetical protein JI749_16240 [Devosia oryziradicis]|uniref:DUF368 domain-containing protein n=1 Tax=Devosia oryziradicis TaxID=2801335 RepID=A0ABX7BVC6_9HYPH|nr:hypothetical protein [Devosia oryziradicis]QQR35868.1 hypothetical protein JI749_16240 [Devosia oryziradicis]